MARRHSFQRRTMCTDGAYCVICVESQPIRAHTTHTHTGAHAHGQCMWTQKKRAKEEEEQAYISNVFDFSYTIRDLIQGIVHVRTAHERGQCGTVWCARRTHTHTHACVFVGCACVDWGTDQAQRAEIIISDDEHIS